jgi:hypothetical protein
MTIETEPQHGGEHIGCGRALAVRRGADGAADAADAAERGADAFGGGWQRIDAGELVAV